ncbi:MAG: hypothetical protein DI564_12835 [Rhodanobacter denitrificans]|uniref:Uncharacterized protein n=1 Tax=Rhodanobacter denitrificans TaxID=666685 RepID=A0A2W5K5F0_9GAMM|nr:MAG: hypothetical protein DI564_12835 [Rhodanobacter denitrificans]
MTRASFDALVTRLAESPTTFSERELLEPTHWSLGEDARLREDLRFRETPWGRWMLAEDLVANDAVYRWLHVEKRGSVVLDAALKRAGEVFGRRCVFCADDPRFVLRHDEVHLSASELSRQPVVEDKVGDLEKYRTHLPLHSLKAAAASEPAGEWGKRAQDQVIETLGWVRVTLPGRALNDRMFIAAIEGHSMDDGKSGLVDGGYAVFELWPSGTKQNLSVLVRGAFSDPETGSYAVKKYVADQRDAEGRHNKVSLVSLNPNKERYPNIELQPEDDDIAVVAKVVQALSTDDYERRPKPKRRVGRRNLTGDEQAARLGRRVASFFDGTAPEADDEDSNTTTSTGWQTRLVCLEVAAGGLQLEVGPLDGLPIFVKKLRVVGTEWDGFVLAANAKTRRTRAPVRPGTGPWRWEAVGFEEEQDLGLDKLALDALDVTGPIVFRVDADGVGQRIKSTMLALGQAYRLLLPPNVGADLGTELDGGWRIWSLDLAAQLSPTTRQTLTALGLDIGEAWPRIEWALAPAAVWRTNARGESYPVFEAGTELLVNVGGVSVEEGDEAVLFLHGPAGTERLSLSSSGLVSLGAPAAGRWACALMHAQTSVQPASLLFEVAEDALEVVGVSSSAVAHSELASLEAAAPPGWPVTLRWRVFAACEELLATLYGNEDGTVPVDSVASIIEARAARARLADLVVDFGELGRRVLPHDGRASLKQVREQLTDLWQKRSGLVQSRKGAWLQLRKPWFEPVTELFGYGLEEATLLADVEAPHDLTAWGLTVDERMMGSITRSPSRVLVLTTDLDAVLRDHRTWIDSACSAAKVRDAIITDGARWTTHRKGSQQLKQQVWSLDHAIGLGSIDEMLGDLAEGL